MRYEDDIPEEAYEAIYGKEIEEDLEVSKEKYPLPKIVQEWVKEGSKFSYNNEFPLTMMYFLTLGQVVKDFIRIPVGANTLDTRVHFCWFQTARTGKTASWNFIKQVTDGLYGNINGDTMPIGIQDYMADKQLDIFGTLSYTEAGLIGTIRENKLYNPQHEQAAEEEGDEYEHLPWRVVRGALEGNGLAHFDEFERSGLFKPTQTQQEILGYFQTFMNGLDSSSYVITKTLADYDFEHECDCRRSMYATTYVPRNFVELVTSTGVLQRTFMFIREVEDEVRRDIAEKFIAQIGVEERTDMQTQAFSQNLTTIFERVFDRWEECGRNAKTTMVFPKEVNDVILQYYYWMKTDSEGLRPEVKAISESFIQNLLNYSSILSALIAISNSRFTVNRNDAHCAGRLVRHSYSALTEWLNKTLRVQRQSALQSAKPEFFVNAYNDCSKDNEGWVNKRHVLKKAKDYAQLSQAQIYKRYNQVGPELFENKKIGKSVYLRLKEDEQ